jgi:hypothetical protein
VGLWEVICCSRVTGYPEVILSCCQQGFEHEHSGQKLANAYF